MSTLPTEPLTINNPEDSKPTQHPPAFVLDGFPENHGGELQEEKQRHAAHPFRKYTRQQLVHLSTSLLVKPPPNMPELKVWFGSEDGYLVKKEDPLPPSTARERRFRRDADDGDAPSRPTFRSGLTQPSQMGNFKHQSLRANDRDRERDRDRDGEKERERDIRDKEGQERLRHLSDKYDRDRLAQPQSNTRNKEREHAPHLNVAARPPQALPSNAASRRAETRESVKKKVGEASEDWRRGADARTGRDDRAENGRKEDRDRARSQVRDTSRAKREPSSSHRDRERDEPREKTLRGDRDDHRRDDARRDRDVEAEEDPRRWRDDGKREERLATRRERVRDKGNQEGHWEGSTDRRWTPGEDRDARYKRSSGRERRPGNGPDDIKEKDDRRDKEREKEKEPAWMDTYIPSDSFPGILGGHGLSGELDGIQAFKKEQKDKELKDKAANLSALSIGLGPSTLEEAPPSVPAEGMKQEPLDEIQLFKRMMLKDQQKSNPDAFPTQLGTHPSSKDDDITTSSKTQRHLSLEDSASTTTSSGLVSKVELRTSNAHPITMDPSSSTDSSPLAVGPKESLSSTKVLPAADVPPTRNSVFASFVGPESSQINPAKQAAEPNGTPSFQPPAGSRLLAFARTPANFSTVSNNLHPSRESTQNYSKNESSQPLSAFSPFEEQRRQPHGFEDTRDLGMPSHHLNIHHRPVEPMFNSNANSPDPNFNGASGPKGSRFAKFFDGKGRDGVPSSKQQHPGGFLSPSPNQNHRPEQPGFGGLSVNPGDGRTMDDLFAMLRNSTQQGNLAPSPSLNASLTHNGALSTQGPSLHTLHQQHLLQQAQHHNSRPEALYDSRADDRSFVPDGMVPGLRPIPPPPRRDNNLAPFGDQVDDSIHYNLQRIAQQQQSRNLDPLYPGPTPIYGQQTNRHLGLPLPSLQQPHYRGGPSPSLNPLGPLPTGPPQQRLPPGLANLGGRPPHEPSQFIALPALPSSVQHSSIHTNALLQQQQHPFNNFNHVGNGFNGAQSRGPAPASHVPNTSAQHVLGNMGHNMDPRLANHHHLMGLGGSGVSGNRINGSFPQQGPAAPSHPTMRAQQQHQPHLMPHMLPHLLPPHLQQQGHPGNNQPAHDLMALLMGGHRE